MKELIEKLAASMEKKEISIAAVASICAQIVERCENNEDIPDGAFDQLSQDGRRLLLNSLAAVTLMGLQNS